MKDLDSAKTEQLKKSLEGGVPLKVALEKIGEERTSFLIKAISDIKLRANTVGGCPIGLQYCGCELWV